MNISIKASHLLTSIAAAMLFVISGAAQTNRLLDEKGNTKQRRNRQETFKTETDSIDPNSVPKGLYVWTVDERFGAVRPMEPDTISHLFQNSNYTEGRYGEYNFTGNLGAPRIARIYNGSQDYMMGSQFVFARPYDWFLKSTQNFVFTNTKSPIANLNYHAAGNKVQGDDRFRAVFATNINKRTGVGFNIDYAYGMGYFRNQNHSSLGGTLYGSYRGDQYQIHAFYNTNHLKNVENGGLEDDTYITNPESFPTSYQPGDMPVRLEGVKNRLNVSRLFLSHRYSVGYYQYVDSLGNVVHRKHYKNPIAAVAADTTGLTPVTTDVAEKKPEQQHTGLERDTALTRQFIPVAAAIHTLNVERNDRRFSSLSLLDNYFRDYHIPGATAFDDTEYLSVQNTFAVEMQEGFKKWVKTGMRIFAKHELARFTLPDLQREMRAETFNYFTLGAQLMRRKSQFLRYDVVGEMRTTGEDWGEFNVEGNIGLDFRLGRDTLSLLAGGFVRNESPAYYYKHYHGRNAWWDKDLDNIFRARLEGRLSYRKTSFKLGMETIQNHVYFQELQAPGTGEPKQGTMKYGVSAEQTAKNIQLVSASVRQDLKWGIFHWENELTLQKSAEENLLPLPLFTGWSNAYLKFKIARVLDTELGADIRYFTKYYAPAYSPIIGNYALQDATYRTRIGNYPWVNAYVNFTLKGVRFYWAYTHLNRSQGNSFLVPHYPTNPSVLRFGISWSFYN